MAHPSTTTENDDAEAVEPDEPALDLLRWEQRHSGGIDFDDELY